QKMHVARLLCVVSGDNMGMVETSGRLDFSVKALHCGWVRDQVFVDDLQGHRALHEPMRGLVDGSHAAAAQEFEDLVTRMVRQFGTQGTVWGDRRGRRFLLAPG